MAGLRFFFGTMGAGKSTMALQIHHNLASRGWRGVLCSRNDRSAGQVSSRLGVAAPALEVGPELDLYEVAAGAGDIEGNLAYMVCDEAQFYEPMQVEQLALAVDDLGLDVYAFGLLADFRGRLFPGTARFLELADERRELQVEACCSCGARATHTARYVEGARAWDGEAVVLGDVGGTGAVTYELLCRSHWRADRVPAGLPAR